jgi:hypothetical protein
MPRECEHGSLRRSCERCADAEEIDELRANRDRAVRLLHLAMAQLRRWNDAYGAHAVTWLPPAGYVRLAEDVDEFTAGLQGPNVPMSRARDTTAEARDAVAPRLDGRVKPL